MAGPICELDQIRDLLRDLEKVLGVQGSFRPTESVQALTLDSPDQLEELFGDLLVDVFGMKVTGL